MTRHETIKLLASKLVEGLLVEALPDPKNPLDIKIQMADGSVVDGSFIGYYDYGDKGVWAAVGYPGPRGFSHGLLGKDMKILTPVPPVEAYREQNAQAA